MKKFYTFLLFASFCIPLTYAQMALVKDFNGTSESSTDGDYDRTIATTNEKLLFKITTFDGVESSIQLWSTDGTTGNTTMLLSLPGKDEEIVEGYYAFTTISPTQLAFIANSNDEQFDIWVTDGTQQNTKKVATSANYIEDLEVLGTSVYYVAKDPETGDNWLIKTDLDNATSTNIYDFGWFRPNYGINKVNDNTLVLLAGDVNDENNLKLFISDGTEAGTKPIALIYDGSGVSQQTVMTKVGNRVFFFYKENGDGLNYLWVTDGTSEGTTKLNEFEIVPFVKYENYKCALAADNKFYFLGVGKGLDSNNDRVLWVSDGTLEGTTPLHNSEDYVRPNALTYFNNKVYFSCYSYNSYNYELYVTDGTPSGTNQVDLTYNDKHVNSVTSIATNGQKLYINGYTNEVGDEIFNYDEAQGLKLYDNVAGSEGSEASNLFCLNDDVIFFGITEQTGFELFKLDLATSIIASKDSKNITLFPNPASNYITIETDEPITAISIVSTNGQIIQKAEGSEMILADIKNGVYYVEVNLKSGQVFHKKLIVNK